MKLIARGLPASVLVVLAAAFVVAPATASAQGQPGPQCTNGIDDDGDGPKDFDDFDNGDFNNPECDTNAAVGGGGGGTPPGDGGTPPGDGGGGFGEDCDGATNGQVTISNAFAKPVGANDWEPFEGQCAIQEQQASEFFALSFTDPNNSGLPQDLSNLYEKGSEISVDFTFTGVDPLFVLATGNDMLADIGGGTAFSGVSGETMTVQGKVPTVQFAFNPGDCTNAQTMDFYGIVVQFNNPNSPFGEFMSAYEGAVIGTNAQTISFGGVQADGTFDTTIDGCGELFYEAYLPNQGLALGGLTEPLAEQLSALGEEVPDEIDLTTLEDNNVPVPGDDFDSEFVSPDQIAPEPIPGASSRRAATAAAKKVDVAGVAIDYRGNSAGSHDVSTAPNKSAVKKAKKAVKKCKKGKLKLKKGKLTCKKKKKR